MRTSDFLSDLKAYLRAVFIQGWAWVSLLFDVLGIVALLRPGLWGLIEARGVVRPLGGGMFLVSFLIANFLAYRGLRREVGNLRAEIHELETIGAKTWVETTNSVLESCQRYPTDGPWGRLDRHGLDVESGVPGYACIRVSLKYGNVGDRVGNLVCGLDRARTELPAIFEPDFCISDKSGTSPLLRGHKERLVPDILQHARLRLLLTVREQPPEEFARALSKHQEYRVVLSYHTESVIRGLSAHHGTVEIKGDLSKYRQEVIERWSRVQKLRHLAELAES